MATAYSYIRFSTPDQIKGDSLRRQSELSEKYAKEHGLELDDSLKLTDLGVSAFDKTNITKGALGRFIDLIDAGRIQKGSYLLVESLDRISRQSASEALTLFLNIINSGVKIVTLIDGVEYSKEVIKNDYTKLLFSIMIMVRANEESETKSKRIRSAWENKRNNLSIKRMTERCPSWIRPKQGEEGFELIEDRANVVREIFNLAKAGLGNTIIIKHLNESGVPCFSSKANGWYDSYVQKILTSCTVYGEFQPKIHREGKVIPVGSPVENYYPAVIDKSEWLLVNSLRKSRATGGGARKGKYISNLFSGLIKCGYCGGPMGMGGRSKVIAGGDRKIIRYVACQTARRGLGCHYKQWNYEELEKILLSFCSSLEFSHIISSGGDKKDSILRIENDLVLVDAELSQVNFKIKNITSVIEGGDFQIDVISERLRDLKGEREALEIKRKSLSAELVSCKSKTSLAKTNFDSIVELIKLMNSLEGGELLELRAKISDLIHRYVGEVRLFPFGDSKIHFDENKYREMLIEFEDDYVEKVINKMKMIRMDESKKILLYFKDFSEIYVYSDGLVNKGFEQHRYAEINGLPSMVVLNTAK